MRRCAPASRRIGLLLLLSCCLSTSFASAEDISLEPIKDNTLFENNDGLVSNGAGEFFFVGKTLLSVSQRAVIAFDIRGSLPVGAVVESAQFTLFMTKTITGPQNIELHRVLANWGEGGSNASLQEGKGAPAQTGDATWQHTFFSSSKWSNSGGDFSPTVSATKAVDQNGFYTWGSTAGMLADVQSWLDIPSTNFGWLLLGNESALGTPKRFNSRENLSGIVPFLDLTYHTRIPGDASDNGIVDGADYTLWADNYLETGRTFSQGDFNGNNVVDGADYTLWADNFDPTPASASAVPEPNTGSLMLLGLAVLGAVRCCCRVTRRIR